MAGEGPNGVLGKRHGYDPIPADKAGGGPESNQTGCGRRGSDGAAGIGPSTGSGEVRRDSSARSAGRSARCSREVVRIFHLPAQRTNGDTAACKLLQVGLAKNERSGFAKPFDSESVLLRLRTFQRESSRGGRHVRSVKIVF